MKNKLIYITLFILASTKSDGQFMFNAGPSPVLNGNIDSVEMITSRYMADNVHDRFALIQKDLYVYDQMHHLSDYYYILYMPLPDAPRDLRPHRTICKYDKLGNLVEQDSYLTNGQSLGKDVYLINDLSVTAKSYGFTKELIDSGVIKLSSAYKIIEYASYGKGRSLFSKSYYKYDTRQRLTEIDCFNSDGSLMYQRFCKYDVAGNVIEDDNPYGDHLTHTYTYNDYDAAGNWQNRKEYIDNSKYDSVGNSLLKPSANPFKIINRKIFYRK